MCIGAPAELAKKNNLQYSTVYSLSIVHNIFLLFLCSTTSSMSARRKDESSTTSSSSKARRTDEDNSDTTFSAILDHLSIPEECRKVLLRQLGICDYASLRRKCGGNSSRSRRTGELLLSPLRPCTAAYLLGLVKYVETKKTSSSAPSEEEENRLILREIPKSCNFKYWLRTGSASASARKPGSRGVGVEGGPRKKLRPEDRSASYSIDDNGGGDCTIPKQSPLNSEDGRVLSREEVGSLLEKIKDPPWSYDGLRDVVTLPLKPPPSDHPVPQRNPRQPWPENLDLPTRYFRKLHDYQRKGVEWMVGRFSKGIGGILADETGLGKCFERKPSRAITAVLIIQVRVYQHQFYPFLFF